MVKRTCNLILWLFCFYCYCLFLLSKNYVHIVTVFIYSVIKCHLLQYRCKLSHHWLPNQACLYHMIAVFCSSVRDTNITSTKVTAELKRPVHNIFLFKESEQISDISQHRFRIILILPNLPSFLYIVHEHPPTHKKVRISES